VKVASALLASEICEVEPRTESLTRSLLEAMERIGRNRREEKGTKLIVSFFILHSMVLTVSAQKQLRLLYSLFKGPETFLSIKTQYRL
jgi:hypothetical protein